MRFLLIALLAVAITASEVFITPQYLDYLRSVVDWEVVEYEESIFKGWTLDEIKQLSRHLEVTEGSMYTSRA